MAPVRRQTMLFSATMTEEVQKLVSLSLKHPVRWAGAISCVGSSQVLAVEPVLQVAGAAALPVQGSWCAQHLWSLFGPLPQAPPPRSILSQGWRRMQLQQLPRS